MALRGSSSSSCSSSARAGSLISRADHSIRRCSFDQHRWARSGYLPWLVVNPKLMLKLGACGSTYTYIFPRPAAAPTRCRGTAAQSWSRLPGETPYLPLASPCTHRVPRAVVLPAPRPGDRRLPLPPALPPSPPPALPPSPPPPSRRRSPMSNLSASLIRPRPSYPHTETRHKPAELMPKLPNREPGRAVLPDSDSSFPRVGIQGDAMRLAGLCALHRFSRRRQ
ncbi:hypothetical protein B0H16DRAFT_691016 [Mycena metata]|uniref:Uncharacterized protein n=1 Tax=Mycena metata TaxID=1033252 RepID=A0AAD7M8F6_9AGAR|nr:hypothetical protein B0H16DRAFT_691016 [Mycena metata]